MLSEIGQCVLESDLIEPIEVEGLHLRESGIHVSELFEAVWKVRLFNEGEFCSCDEECRFGW